MKVCNYYASVPAFVVLGQLLFASGDALTSNNQTPAANSSLFSSRGSASQSVRADYFEHTSFDTAVLNRYACKKFRRFDGAESGTESASEADPTVVQQAIRCLHLARRSPTAFNTQPYKVVLVHSTEQKLALSNYGLGPNKTRIRDSDCTAIFLADRQVCRSLRHYRQFLDRHRQTNRRAPSKKDLFLMQFYITLFSSGYPLPRFLSATISFCVRTAVALLNIFTSAFYPLPSLANAETWSSKQTTMVALTFMLGCTSLGLATIPMEGINARGIRKVIGAPSRYAIPLIVSTGRPYSDTVENEKSTTSRYPLDEIVFDDKFGSSIQKLAPTSDVLDATDTSKP